MGYGFQQSGPSRPVGTSPYASGAQVNQPSTPAWQWGTSNPAATQGPGTNPGMAQGPWAGLTGDNAQPTPQAPNAGIPTFDYGGVRQNMARPGTPTNSQLGAGSAGGGLGGLTGGAMGGIASAAAPAPTGGSTPAVNPADQAWQTFSGLDDASKAAVIAAMGSNAYNANTPQGQLFQRFHNSLGTPYNPNAVGGLSEAYKAWANPIMGGNAPMQYNPMTGWMGLPGQQTPTRTIDPKIFGFNY